MLNTFFKARTVFCLLALTGAELHAMSLEQGMSQVLSSNPVVQERLSNYRATVQDLQISQSGYRPKLDLVSSHGRARTNSRVTNFNQESYNFYESSLILSQNLFTGLATKNQIAFQEQRILASANNYIEKVNDISFSFVNVYLQVLRNQELLTIAADNVANHKDIFTKVDTLYESGQTTLSEVEKIQSSLALAQANMVVQENNLMDAQFNLRRVLGTVVALDSFVKPSFNVSLPDNLEQAVDLAIKNNPSILTSNHNISANQFLHRERKHTYYPQVDLQLSQSISDNSGYYSEKYGGRVNETRAAVVFSWNLYNGGADKAEVQKQVSKINQEHQIRDDLQRQVVEGMQLSWSAYTMLDKQLQRLVEYRDFSESTLQNYEDEYDFGRRTLLDLLAAQSDFNSAKSEIVTGQYNKLFAKYRIHDAMGTMVVSVLGNVDLYLNAVGLANQKPEMTLDKLPPHETLSE